MLDPVPARACAGARARARVRVRGGSVDVDLRAPLARGFLNCPRIAARLATRDTLIEVAPVTHSLR